MYFYPFSRCKIICLIKGRSLKFTSLSALHAFLLLVRFSFNFHSETTVTSPVSSINSSSTPFTGYLILGESSSISMSITPEKIAKKKQFECKHSRQRFRPSQPVHRPTQPLFCSCCCSCLFVFTHLKHAVSLAKQGAYVSFAVPSTSNLGLLVCGVGRECQNFGHSLDAVICSRICIQGLSSLCICDCGSLCICDCQYL